MSSDEAKALEESVPEGGRTKEWSSMATGSSADSSNIEEGEEDAAAVSLVSKNKKKSGISGAGNEDEVDDIYSSIDEPDEADREDPVLDVPLNELRGSPFDRFVGSARRWSLKMYKRLYGDKLPPSEMIRTLCLASTLFFMIGGYWLLRSVKDPVLMALCGYKAIPKAKMLSVFIVLGVVSIYNKLLDSSLPKHQLFYVFGTFYFCLFLVISLLLMDDDIGLPNKYQSESRVLGWIAYCSIESFGSVMVSLFWSFTNSNISLETAKSSYGVMVATAQLGSILGPAIVNTYAETWGLANCFLTGSFAMLLLQGTMYNYVRLYGTSDQNKNEDKQQDDDDDAAPPKPKKKEKAGILEGLRLFWEHNYVKGIFAISCLFMVEVTIVDFTLKVLAQQYFSEEYPCEMSNPDCYDAETGEFGFTEEATNALASFMGLFGVATNTLSFVFSLLGTSAIVRKFGLRMTLLLFPSLCLGVIIMVRLYPSLYVVFFAMILLKGNSYALNNPTKEMLYQPTSPSVKYKAKSWIDIFGARGSKALGSLVTNAFSYSVDALVANGSLVGMAVASFLIWNARFMGKKFDEYMESGYIVGEEDNPETRNIQMAIEQNEEDDTSCALEMAGEEDEDEGDEDEEEEDKKFAKKPLARTEMV